MRLKNHIGVSFFSLVLTLPFFRSGLGEMDLQQVIWLVYALGLLVPLILLRKTGVRISSLPDIMLLAFVFLYIVTAIYTIADDYRTKLLLLTIIPLYYFNAKIIMQWNLLELLVKYIMYIFLGFTVYLLFWLNKVDFQYRIYLDYTDALFKVSYLDTTIFSVVLVIYLLTKTKKTVFEYSMIAYFSFITFISGSRFSIIFMTVLLMVNVLFFASKFFDVETIRNKITAKSVLVTFLGIISLTASITYAFQKYDLMPYFAYSAHRLGNMLHEDNSIDGRIDLIDRSLYATNSNTFWGNGVGSSQIILGEEYSHNMLLETWIESGLINATILALMLIYGVYQTSKIIKKGGLYLFISLSYYYLTLSYLKSFSVTDSRMLIFFYGAVVTGAFVVRQEKNIKV
jgi:hypothetical protein